MAAPADPRHHPGGGPHPVASGDGSPGTMEAGDRSGPAGEARGPRRDGRTVRRVDGSAGRTPCEKPTPPPLEGGGWGEGFVLPEPLPPTPSHKGRGSLPCRPRGSAGRTPCTNSADPHPGCAATGAGEQRCASGGKTLCTKSRRTPCEQRLGAGPVGGAVGGAGKSPCTRTGGRRGCHRPGGCACRSGVSADRTPCTNSAGPRPGCPGRGACERPCGTGGKTPCTRTRRARARQPHAIDRPCGAALAAAAEAHAPEPSSRPPAVTPARRRFGWRAFAP